MLVRDPEVAGWVTLFGWVVVKIDDSKARKWISGYLMLLLVGESEGRRKPIVPTMVWYHR